MPVLRIALLLVTVLSLPPSYATSLFGETAVIDATLEGPLRELMGDKDSNEQLPFLLRVDGMEHEVKVRLRGKSRLRVCDFLPMRLNFRKNEMDGTLFEGQNKLKLVVPCHTSERAEKNLVEEYAVYRIFNLLTPASYRVRLLHMTFVDTGLEADNERMHVFLLEPSAKMAERLGGREAELAGVSRNWLDPDQMALVYVFQYLVSNVDWSLVSPADDESCCHNGTLVETDATTLYIPYDFDLSGFVDAPYAYPPSELRVDSVTQRRYRGFCTDRNTLEQALHSVVSRKEDIAALIASLPVLSDRNKRSRISYLEKFFQAAANEDRLLERFENRCLD
jgi:hypothetical protein